MCIFRAEDVALVQQKEARMVCKICGKKIPSPEKYIRKEARKRK